jgi:hypothetical protein
MNRRFALWTLTLAAMPVFAADGIAGTWALKRQELNGEVTQTPPVRLRIYQTADSLSFAFATLVNDAYVTSMGYRAPIDGSQAEVKNAKGEKMGTVSIKPAGATSYTITMGRPGHADTSGKLTLSADGKTLTAETETMEGQTTVRLFQQFTRE